MAITTLLPKIALGLALFFLLLVLQIQLWVGPGSVREIKNLKEKIHTQIQENTYLRALNKDLQFEVTDLKEGLAAIEERARLGLGMIREDETFYQIVRLPKIQTHK